MDRLDRLIELLSEERGERVPAFRDGEKLQAKPIKLSRRKIVE